MKWEVSSSWDVAQRCAMELHRRFAIFAVKMRRYIPDDCALLLANLERFTELDRFWESHL
jgi:hypothetical protein